MTQPTGPGQNPGPSNQVNSANNNSQAFANYGRNQRVRITTNTTQPHPRRVWAWIALVGLLVADVGYSMYGQSAYTGVSEDSGDLTRALIFFVLVIITGIVLRVCVRDVKQRWF
ncbi:hypothetical protein AB0M22_05735 [Nocardia sp. NPDC051756]|uniref:hypothetical protein n=1 Tax=Nocardia sp. NPDC051756 TaxID=3154751 RepID=UPI003437FF3D